MNTHLTPKQIEEYRENGLLAHAAGANMTPGWRRAMTCGFMPDGCTFNGKRNIPSTNQMERLKIGDVLNDDSQNPLIYHSAKPCVTPDTVEPYLETV